MRWIFFVFLFYYSTAFGFWNDNHVKKAWSEHKQKIETVTATHRSAQNLYKMAYWAANEAYKLTKNSSKYYASPEELASIRSYLQLSHSIFSNGTGFGGIKNKPINSETRDLAKKTLTILGLMVKGDPFFSFEKKSTVLAKVQKHRAKEFVEKVQQIKLSQQISAKPKVSETFLKEVSSFTDDSGKTILSELLRYEPISLFPATLEEEDLATDAHLGICPECKEMQATPREMEKWWQDRIKEDPTGRNIDFEKAFDDSFYSYRTSWEDLRYLEGGIKKGFKLSSGIDFNIYIPKHIQLGTPVVFMIYDGIMQDHRYPYGFAEENILAHAGCIVVKVQGMGKADHMEPENIKELRYNYTNFPNQIFEDIEDIYIALRDQIFVKKDGSSYPQLIAPGKTKVFLRGSSFGGYMTMMAATSDHIMKKAIPGVPFKDLFDGYMPYAGFYDWAQDQTNLENSEANVMRGRFARNRDYRTRTDQDGNRFTIKQHTLYLASDPLTDKSINEKMSPIHHLDRLNRPVLLMHGLKDPNVGADAALNLLYAVRKAKKQHLIDPIILPEQQHDSDGNGGNAYSINKHQTTQLIKDYFDPILYFIRQIQNDERPYLWRRSFNEFKALAQRVKLASAENKLLENRRTDYHEGSYGPLTKLINVLKSKLEASDNELIELLKYPTEQRIIDFAKVIPVYKDKTFGGESKPDRPSTIFNKGAQKRLVMLFLEAIYTIATNPRDKTLLATIFPDTKSLTSHSDPLLWLESQVLYKLDDLKSWQDYASRMSLGHGSSLSYKTTFEKLNDGEFSDDNIIEFLKELPAFFGIAGPYEITPFFYQLRRTEIRQAIRNVLFPGEWLYHKLKENIAKEKEEEEKQKYSSGWPSTPDYKDTNSFLYQCINIDSLPEVQVQDIYWSFSSYSSYHNKLPDEPARKRLLDMKQEEFTKTIQGWCLRLSKEVK